MTGKWFKRGAAAVGLLLVVVLVGGYVYGRMRRGSRQLGPLVDVWPAFAEGDGGARSPTTALYGFEVGRHTLSQVQQILKERGVSCVDSSMRAMMQVMREAKAKELEETKAKGGDVDAVTGASILWNRSKKEENPQLRLSCEDVLLSKLDVPGRPLSLGRLLLIFDSKEHPLRHVSFSRNHTQGALAAADFDAGVTAFTAAFGAPTTAPSEPPGQADGGALPWLVTYEHLWTYGDVTAKVSALNMGEKRGLSVSESVEVPWPVRVGPPLGVAAPPPQAQ